MSTVVCFDTGIKEIDDLHFQVMPKEGIDVEKIWRIRQGCHYVIIAKGKRGGLYIAKETDFARRANAKACLTLCPNTVAEYLRPLQHAGFLSKEAVDQAAAKAKVRTQRGEIQGRAREVFLHAAGLIKFTKAQERQLLEAIVTPHRISDKQVARIEPEQERLKGILNAAKEARTKEIVSGVKLVPKPVPAVKK